MATSSGQCARSCIMSHAEFFGETPNHPGDLASPQPRFCALQFLGFPKTKLTSERVGITFNKFSTIFEAFVPHFYLYCTHCIVPKSLLNPNSFHGGMFKLHAKFDGDSFAVLSHFECNGHIVHLLTLQPPLTSTVKSSLFTHAHSSPLSMAARFH